MYLKMTVGPAGLPLEVLTEDFWVPSIPTRAESCKFRGKPIFQEILATTAETALLYAGRAAKEMSACVRCLACEDFSRRVGKEASTKAKKNAMLSEEEGEFATSLRKSTSFLDSIRSTCCYMTAAVSGFGCCQSFRAASVARSSRNTQSSSTRGA